VARRFRDYYEALGLDPSASPDDVVQTYRELARLYHPDTLAGKSESIRKRAEAEFKRVQEAYEVLSDPATRAEYDSAWKQFHGASSADSGASSGAKAHESRTKWVCFDCGETNAAARGFCADCGCSREEAIEVGRRVDRVEAIRNERRELRASGFEVCPSCGAFRNSVDARFCGGCGDDLEAFWSVGAYDDDYHGGVLCSYGLSPSEVFQCTLEAFQDREITDCVNVDRRLTVKLPKGLFDRRLVQVRVDTGAGSECKLIVVPAPGPDQGDPEACHRVLARIQKRLEESWAG
jgi:DnaJ-domain-containing protein 1